MSDDSAQLVRTLNDLRGWLDNLPAHSLQLDASCECGWQPTAGRQWMDHNEYDDMNSLYDVLASPTDSERSVTGEIEWMHRMIHVRDLLADDPSLTWDKALAIVEVGS